MPRSANTLSALKSAPGSLRSVKTTEVLSGGASGVALTADGEEPRDVVVEVLDARAQRLEPEQLAGARRGDGRRVAPLLVAHHLRAPRRVVGRDRFDAVEAAQEPRALRQRLRMRQDPPDFLEPHARQREQLVHDRHLDFADDRELALDEQVVVAVNRAADRVLDRDDAEADVAGVDGVEHLVEGRVRARLGGGQQAQHGRFAECAGLSLIRDSHR